MWPYLSTKMYFLPPSYKFNLHRITWTVAAVSEVHPLWLTETSHADLVFDAYILICQVDVLANDSDVSWYLYLFGLKVITELSDSENKVTVISSLHSGPLKPVERYAFQFDKQEFHSSFKTESDVNHCLILLWWSPVTGETGRLGQCRGDVCFFTINKTYQHNVMTRAFLFYGKDLFLFKEVTFPPAQLFSFRD